MCSLFLEENEIIFTIFIEDYFPFLEKSKNCAIYRKNVIAKRLLCMI